MTLGLGGITGVLPVDLATASQEDLLAAWGALNCPSFFPLIQGPRRRLFEDETLEAVPEEERPAMPSDEIAGLLTVFQAPSGEASLAPMSVPLKADTVSLAMLPVAGPGGSDALLPVQVVYLSPFDGEGRQ